MTDQRMKWDAEAAFKRIEHDSKIYAQETGQGERASRFLYGKRPHKFGWTPAPDPALFARHEADKPHGRDIESLMRYHKAHKKPVGYWEDAPRGMKFAQDSTCPKCGNMMVAGHYCSTGGATASTTTPPADGPWPKWLIADTYIRRFDGPMGGCTCYHISGRMSHDPLGWWNVWSDDPRVCSQSEALQWLEQNGHKDVAAQLRGKAAADDPYEPVGTMPVVGDTYVFTDGRGDNPVTFVDVSATHYADRVWARQCQDNGELWTSDSTHAEREWYARNGRILKRPTKPRDDGATGARAWADDGFAWAQVGGTLYSRVPDGRFVESVSGHTGYLKPEWELHGTERDTILAECRKTMGLDTSSAGKDT